MRVTEILLQRYKSDIEYCKIKLQYAIKRDKIEECDKLINDISILDRKINTIQQNSHFLSKDDIKEAKTWGQ
jgi:hypothetical protein